jgi:hypothetical protein
MKKEKVKSKAVEGILLFLIFTQGIGKSEVRIPNIGIGGGIFRSYEGFIKPEVDVRFRFPYNLGLEAKSFIFVQEIPANWGKIRGLYFWEIRGFSPYIGIGVETFFIKELREGSVASIVEFHPAWNIGVEFGLGNFTFSPEISFSKATSFSLSGYYNFIPKTEKKNPQEKKITYITTIGGALCGLTKSLLLGALMMSYSGKRFSSNPYYYSFPLIEGGICGYFTGKLISSWVKKDEGLVSSIAKGACSGLLGGTASFITEMVNYHISGWAEFNYSEPSLGLLVSGANISLWTISGAIYGAIAR